MKSKPRIGLFFGSFNPIHIGHLVIANYLSEYTDLNEIWFVVSPQNPLKEKSSLLTDHHRLALVNLAIEGFPKFKSCDIEFKLAKPSYTIDTLSYLAEKHPNKDFALIIGADNLTTFRKWKNYQVLLSNYQFYVYPRPGEEKAEFLDHPNVKLVDAPMVEISSSFIRKAIKDKKDVRYFLTPPVYQYIEEMHFYKK